MTILLEDNPGCPVYASDEPPWSTDGKVVLMQVVTETAQDVLDAQGQPAETWASILRESATKVHRDSPGNLSQAFRMLRRWEAGK